MDERLESMARELEASGAYRVLRRLDPPPAPGSDPAEEGRLAILLDVETTGTDPRTCEIIELAMTPFRYGPDGRILGHGPPFDELNEPKDPIPAEITAITGITDEMTRGRRIAWDAVEALIAPAALILAHNAAFDRRFLERACPAFQDKPWACTMSEVDWRAEGFESEKLEYLALRSGFFYEKHRALSDCYAAVELLSRPLPVSGRPALAVLLERARRPSWRIWAENAPYDFKDALKARGYRWNGEADGRPRAWWRDVADEEKAAELAFLETQIYRAGATPTVRRVTARERHSDRC